jgi:hypothetical protein
LIITFNQGASTPVQTPTTWELPLALLTGTTLADQRYFANPRTAFPVVPGSGFHSFVDPQGVTWVSYGGSAWKRATDSLVGRVYAGATVQDVPPGAWTKLTNWDTVDTDAYHCWDGTNKNWIIPLAGLYRFNARMSVETGGAGPFRLITTLYRNGASSRAGTDITVSTAGAMSGFVDAMVNCAVGDTVAIWTFNTGGSLGVSTDTGQGVQYFELSLDKI